MKRMVDPLVQININSEFDSRIEALEDAPAGTKLYQHNISFTDPDSSESVSITYVCGRAEAFTTPSDFLGYLTTSGSPRLTYAIVGETTFAIVMGYTTTDLGIKWREFNASEGSYIPYTIGLGTEAAIPWETLTDSVIEL